MTFIVFCFYKLPRERPLAIWKNFTFSILYKIKVKSAACKTAVFRCSFTLILCICRFFVCSFGKSIYYGTFFRNRLSPKFWYFSNSPKMLPYYTAVMTPYVGISNEQSPVDGMHSQIMPQVPIKTQLVVFVL